MATERQTEWIIEHDFDPQSCRHHLNGTTSVLHCHHFSSLYSQLADDAEMVDGKQLLRRAAELAFLPVFEEYFKTNTIGNLEDRLSLIGDYFRLIGLGTLTFENVGEISSTVCMDRSHVDEGWIRKWGKREAPVNFIGQGFIAAAMAAVFNQPAGSYSVREIQSIVSGADSSRFSAVRA